MIPQIPVFEQAFSRLPTVFTRLRGRTNAVREYRALVAPTAEYCVLPVVDAYHLGYPEAAGGGSRLPSLSGLTFASYTGYERGIAIKMANVEIGSISFRDVEFLAFDMLQATGFDVVLGQSLLRETRLDLDYGSHTLKLEKL
jgi:hypothetical protein